MKVTARVACLSPLLLIAAAPATRPAPPAGAIEVSVPVGTSASVSENLTVRIDYVLVGAKVKGEVMLVAGSERLPTPIESLSQTAAAVDAAVASAAEDGRFVAEVGGLKILVYEFSSRNAILIQEQRQSFMADSLLIEPAAARDVAAYLRRAVELDAWARPRLAPLLTP